SLRSNSATFAPLAASARALASPRPEAPPVTTAAIVESIFIWQPFLLCVRLARTAGPSSTRPLAAPFGRSSRDGPGRPLCTRWVHSFDNGGEMHQTRAVLRLPHDSANAEPECNLN